MSHHGIHHANAYFADTVPQPSLPEDAAVGRHETGGDIEPSVFSRLGQLALGQSVELTPEYRGALATGEKYRLFLPIKETTVRMEQILDQPMNGHTPEFASEVKNTLDSLVSAADLLKLSMQRQEEYGLVDHRWTREKDYMEKALASGRRAIELDIRTDKDGGFWVSHALGANASILPPYIGNLSTADMEKWGSRFSLDEALNAFSPYKSDHKLVLELKSLGPVEKHPEALDNLKELLRAHGAEGSVAVASLNPRTLVETHKAMPDMPLIMNGGIGVAFAAPGKQKEAVIARLPEELTGILKEQQSQELGGVISLSAVTILASALDVFGLKKPADEMRRYYKQVTDELGIKTMATTWGQGLSKLGVPGLSAPEQIAAFDKLGIDVIYTKAPEEFAHTLPAPLTDRSRQR